MAVITTEASPRAVAAEAATAEAAAWLEQYLHGGPRPSGELHHDADQAGLSRYYLYRASDALAVKRSNRGRHSAWALPQHYAPDPLERRCDGCGENSGQIDDRDGLVPCPLDPVSSAPPC